MRLVESNENKITRDKNGENVPHLETTEVILVIVTLLTVIMKKFHKFCIHLFQINHLVNY